MFFISVLVALTFAIYFPLVMSQRVFSVEYEPAENLFNQTLGDFFQINGFYFMLLILLASLSLLLLSIAKSKVVFALAFAGNVGIMSYFIYEFTNIAKALDDGVRQANETINVYFHIYYTPAMVITWVVFGIFAAWSVFMIVLGLIRIQRQGTKLIQQ